MPIKPLPRPAALNAHATDPLEEHVVLATDGRAGASAATRWLAERARSHIIDVDIVHVVAASAGPSDDDDPTARAQTYLAVIAPSVEARTRVAIGVAHDVLVDLTRAADLAVLGTRRTAGAPHLVASFATRFAESAGCPVVVVPEGWRASVGPVVVGVEGDGSDTAAVEFAAHEASVLHRDLVLVHAWQLAPLAWPALEVDPAGHATAHGPSARLAAVADPLRERHPEVRVLGVLEHDAPVRALVRDARAASLLVVGHPRSRLDRALPPRLDQPGCAGAAGMPGRGGPSVVLISAQAHGAAASPRSSRAAPVEPGHSCRSDPMVSPSGPVGHRAGPEGGLSERQHELAHPWHRGGGASGLKQQG